MSPGWDRGFESHVGSFMWNLESHTKLMWKNPFVAVGADWGRHLENGSSSHFAEPRHATTGTERVDQQDLSTDSS